MIKLILMMRLKVKAYKMFRRLYFVNASPDWEILLVVLSDYKQRPEQAGVRTERWGYGRETLVIVRTSGSERGRTSE